MRRLFLALKLDRTFLKSKFIGFSANLQIFIKRKKTTSRGNILLFQILKLFAITVELRKIVALTQQKCLKYI